MSRTADWTLESQKQGGERPTARDTLKATLKAILPDRAIFRIRRIKAGAQRLRLIQVPTLPEFIGILQDDAFQRSVGEIKYITQFDTARLANLWQLCRMSDPCGTVLEVGVYRGGTSTHLMNCHPDAKFIVADTFLGADYDEVRERLSRKTKLDDRLTILKGVFPDSDTLRQVGDISFAHVDVVLYESCRRTLDYIRERCRPAALIVINDYLRHEGITTAAREFVEAHPEWIVLPLYPGQGLAITRGAFEAG